MIDNYAVQERIAIMQDSHITEKEALKLIESMKWKEVIDRMKSHPKPKKQVELKVPHIAPMLDRKSMAGGIDE